MKQFDVEFYYDVSERSPVADWIDDLVANDHKKNERILLQRIRHMFNLVQTFGPALSLPDGRKLTGVAEPPIWEIRIKTQNYYRIFWTLWQGNALMLHWIQKDTDKTPPRDIAKAQSNYWDWVRRFGI